MRPGTPWNAACELRQPALFQLPSAYAGFGATGSKRPNAASNAGSLPGSRNYSYALVAPFWNALRIRSASRERSALIDGSNPAGRRRGDGRPWGRVDGT